jgi:hypothetical protein
MEEMNINIVAILIAVVAHFIFGFIWYTPLFGKAWGKEMGFDMTKKPPASAMMKGMGLMIIGNFLMAWVLSHNIMAWSYVPGVSEMSPAQNALSAAFFTWLGFFLPMDLNTVAWEMKSWKLFFINTVYHFLALIIVAFILVFMG